MPIDDRASSVDAACDGAERWVEIAGRLEAEAALPSADHPLAPFIVAFYYDYVERNRQERRDEFGPYAPMVEADSFTFPPRLETVSDEAKAAWADVAQLCQQPAAQARLNDLLWVTRHGDRPDLSAGIAIDAYLALAGNCVGLSKARCLVRSLELCREINDAERSTKVIRAAVAAARECISDDEWKPGVALRLIGALLEVPAVPSEVDELLTAAGERNQADPFIGDAISDMMAKRAKDDAARVVAIRRTQTARWQRHAADADKLAAIAHLQHGLEVARTHGLAEEATEFLRALQELDLKPTDLAKVRAEVSVDADAVEALLDSFVQADWPTSLRMLGAYGPPSGDSSRSETAVRQMMKEYPVQFLFTRTVLGPENTVIANVTGDDAHFKAELAGYERQGIQLFATLVSEGLMRIASRHGRPDKDVLVDYFANGVVAPEHADAFSRGLLLFFDEQYDESALVVVPRIEATIRELARRAGLVVIRPPLGEKPGGVRSLGETLISLSEALDPSWWRYLRNALADPLGLNLRNRLAHGLMPGTREAAAVLLHIACFLPLLRLGEDVTESSPN